MHFELAYMVLGSLLFLVVVFYLSPFELKVNDDDEED
ncbi:MAG: hypothetical protein JWQ54_4609 [Mucilaginibacter sp.]|jgi:hypothetical protein|nr:hypothetical protein [Mucilaginibacter sp.]MDB5086326.1 hypothetical protein [Mucilaginibacter sp.]